MATSRWAQALIAVFPNLSGEDFEIVDQPSDAYNCIAYAANDTNQRWDPNTDDYWPSWVPGNNLIDSLKQVFAGLGYEECEGGMYGEVTVFMRRPL